MSIPTIRHFMTSGPETIGADLNLAQARDRMFQLNARHLPVVANGELVGILSDRDISLIDSVFGDLTALQVRQAMTAQPFTCGPEAHIHAVAAEMAAHKYGTAIVVDREHPGHVIGLFTTTDALRALAQLTDHTAPAQ
ncbi:MAG: CBS domain-containing protein [Nannocystis sp.]|nr:CBS domain-containing protein [Nannocystis sp.]MBA3548673.1 CBS domain-containing protein [Nannocystis sp.]